MPECTPEHYDDVVAYLFSLQKPKRDPTHARMRRLLHLIGEPQKRFTVVSVGGTTGKGSTSSAIAAILMEMGYRVGLLISPHVHDFNERIRLNGEPIAHDRLVELARALEPVLEQLRQQPPSGAFAPCFTEVMLAIALNHFEAEGVELAVVEAGLGGAHDPSSVLDAAVTVITNVSLDHTHILGETVAAIAEEKAGLVPLHGILLTSSQDPEVLAVFERRCRAQAAVLYIAGRDFSVRRTSATSEGATFTFDGFGKRYEELRYHRPGAHQLENAALSIAAIETLVGKGSVAREPDRNLIQAGINKSPLVARMEIIHHGPLVLIDGAHNVAALGALRDTIRTEFRGEYERLILLFGLATNKPVDDMVKAIVPIADELIATSGPYRGIAPTTIAEAAKGYLDAIVCENDTEKAVERALERTGRRDMLCVTGSMYMIDRAREILLHKLLGR